MPINVDETFVSIATALNVDVKDFMQRSVDDMIQNIMDALREHLAGD